MKICAHPIGFFSVFFHLPLFCADGSIMVQATNSIRIKKQHEINAAKSVFLMFLCYLCIG